MREAVETARKDGLSLADARRLVNEVYGVRCVEGFEVAEGWEMPSPPREGLLPYFAMHGCDGISYFWWDPAWGKWASSSKAWDKAREEGLDTRDMDDAWPLVDHDTGDDYKACAAALRALGFNEV